MPHVDTQRLINIITCSPAQKNLEREPWKQNCYVNLDGFSVHQLYFQQVSETLYIDILINDTVDIVDYIIENMMVNGKDEWGGNV